MSVRRILLVLLLAAALALWVAGLAGAASPRIICPLASFCCPLPIAATDAAASQPCCQTGPTVCLASPTISAAPNPSSAGRPVTVSGVIPGADAGRQVTLWQELAGQSRFASVATAGTNSESQYAFVLGQGAVQTNRQWYVTASGERSGTVDEHVAAQVTLTRSLHVHVSPNHAGERVWLEQREGAAWTVIARARLNASSSAAIRAAVSANRPPRLRAVLPGDRRNVTSYSRALSL